MLVFHSWTAVVWKCLGLSLKMKKQCFFECCASAKYKIMGSKQGRVAAFVWLVAQSRMLVRLAYNLHYNAQKWDSCSLFCSFVFSPSKFSAFMTLNTGFKM